MPYVLYRVNDVTGSKVAIKQPGKSVEKVSRSWVVLELEPRTLEDIQQSICPLTDEEISREDCPVTTTTDSQNTSIRTTILVPRNTPEVPIGLSEGAIENSAGKDAKVDKTAHQAEE